MVAILAALATSLNARADVYDVNRYFTDGVNQVTLTGTVALPEGYYIITDNGASPFTSVNLTLAINGTPYNLDMASTRSIYGTGQFSIDATSATLTFNTADADGPDPADLDFLDNSGIDFYAIGYDNAPGFEAAYDAGGGFFTSAPLPTVFGTAVPEPATLALAGLGGLSMLFLRRQKS